MNKSFAEIQPILDTIDATPLRAALIRASTYKHFYELYVMVRSEIREIEREIQTIWKDTLFDRLVRFRPPFDEIWCVDEAQAPVLAAYRGASADLHAIEKQALLAMRRLISRHRRRRVQSKRPSGTYRVVRVICPTTYMSFGANAPRYRKDEVDAYRLAFREAGISAKTSAVVTDEDSLHAKGSILIEARAAPWMLDFVLRRHEMVGTQSLERLLKTKFKSDHRFDHYTRNHGFQTTAAA